MLGNIDLTQLAAEIAEHLPATLPLSVQLWSADVVAQYLDMKKRYVLEKLLVRPDAPKPIRMYNSGQPRYKALEVIAWAEKYQEKKRA